MFIPAADNYGSHETRLVTRRQLMALAGATGFAAALGACGQKPDMANSAPSTTTGPPATTLYARAPGMPAQAPPPPPPVAATSKEMLCRSAWRAAPSTGEGVRHTITKMTIHHTGVALGDNRNAPGRLLQHQQLHQNDRGWIDIAYHVGIDRNGNIYELRTPDFKGDTATDYDTNGHFLVLCEGNFDEESVPEEMLHSAATAFAWAASIHPIEPREVRGHKNFASTECPGKNLYEHVESGELTQRVNDILRGGRVDLQTLCGPEAAERIAQIEAGQR